MGNTHEIQTTKHNGQNANETFNMGDNTLKLSYTRLKLAVAAVEVY